MSGSRRGFLVAAGAVAGGLGAYPGAVAGEPTNRITVGTGMAALDEVAAAHEESGVGLETIEADGFGAFLADEVDVQHAARPMTAEERERAAEEGVEFEEREFPVGGVATLESEEGWCRCLSEEDREGFGDGGRVETWAEVVSAGGVGPAADLPGAGSAVLVRGTRAGQYAIGHGGVGYQKAAPSEFGPVDGSNDTPVVRLGFVYVASDALGREAVAGLVDRYDDDASDVETVPSTD